MIATAIQIVLLSILILMCLLSLFLTILARKDKVFFMKQLFGWCIVYSLIIAMALF